MLMNEAVHCTCTSMYLAAACDVENLKFLQY